MTYNTKTLHGTLSRYLEASSRIHILFDEAQDAVEHLTGSKLGGNPKAYKANNKRALESLTRYITNRNTLIELKLFIESLDEKAAHSESLLASIRTAITSPSFGASVMYDGWQR